MISGADQRRHWQAPASVAVYTSPTDTIMTSCPYRNERRLHPVRRGSLSGCTVLLFVFLHVSEKVTFVVSINVVPGSAEMMKKGCCQASSRLLFARPGRCEKKLDYCRTFEPPKLFSALKFPWPAFWPGECWYMVHAISLSDRVKKKITNPLRGSWIPTSLLIERLYLL